MDWTHMDWQAVWAEEFAAREASQGKRLRDDAVELAFWERLAPQYDTRHRLNEEVPGLVDYLQQVLGAGRFVREIGPGTGNFTMPLARTAARWEGIEFAPPMQRQVEKKIAAAGWTHVHIRSGKWEDIVIDEPADVLLAVNSLYRIERLQEAIDKMVHTTREALVLVRTLQYRESALQRYAGAKGHVHPDFYLMVNMLWAHGLPVEIRAFPFMRKYYADGGEDIAIRIDGEDAHGAYRLLEETVMTAYVSLR